MHKAHDFFIYLKGDCSALIYVSAAEVEFLGNCVFFRLPDSAGFYITCAFFPISIIEKIEDDSIHQFIEIKQGEVLRL